MSVRRIAPVALAFAFALVTTLHAQDAPPLSPPGDAQHNDAGLSWSVTTAPTGTASPTLDDYVTLDYTGWNAKGELVDSTKRHPDLRIFAMSSLFAGLQQPLLTMKVGEQRRLWVPTAMTPKKTAPMVFDVTLLDISRPFDPPADVAAPPADAEHSKSGLAWKVLKSSSATEHPKGDSSVVVDYSGWTTDGKMFDSSVKRNEAATLQMDAVIAGWQEALKMMVPGEKRRLWIPAKLAYRGDRRMPQGMLVFDLELVRIEAPVVRHR